MTYATATKRSITIAGHETSIRLEPAFWQALEHAAGATGLPLNALVARIDADRLDAPGGVPNLTSAIRQYLLARAVTGGSRGADDRGGEGSAPVGGEFKP